MTDDFDAFLAQYRNSSEERWLDGLIEADLVSLDWPDCLCGSGLQRLRKLDVINQLIDAGCPLFPESITVTAPMLLALGTTEQQSAILAELRQAPRSWRHELVDETFWLVGNGARLQLGGDGKAALHLATASSALFDIYELKTTLRHLEGLRQRWAEEMQADITELNVTLASLEGLYLQNSPEQDLQISLGINQQRLKSFSMLFDSMGYYALLDPDPNLAGNEPLPFENERRHLRQLRKSQHRDEMLQQDLVYQQLLEKMGL